MVLQSKQQSEKQIERSHSHSHRLIIIVVAVICLVGIGLGFWYNQLPKNNPQRDQSSCEQAGGEWRSNEKICLISNRVAGEECTDGGQCKSGICFPPPLTQEQQLNITNGSAENIVGTCYSEEVAEGCVKQVVNGTVTLESLCFE